MADSAAELPLAKPNLAGRRLGRYEVLTQLASGGMAAVYVGRAIGMAGFERLVAIKVLHPHLAYEEEFVSMFLDEARLAARIRHPNVVATQDISDTHGDGLFLVMDYIEGDHLGGLLGRASREEGRLPPPVVATIVVEALFGLGAAHELEDDHGVPLHLVHRDISPHNVMVGADGTTRLTDFGVAKAEVRLSSTRDGQLKGKLSYMAPEQASTGEADQRSDLFSMGIILWESLTGRRLFRAENNAATLTRILSDPIPLPSSISPGLAPFDAISARALDRDPEARFQTADEFARALEEAAAAAGGLASSRSVAEYVNRLAGPKLEKDRRRVAHALELMGRAGLGEAPCPMPRDGSGSAINRRPAKAPESTPAADEPTIASSPSGKRRERRARASRWALGIAALCAVAAAGAALYLLGEPAPAPPSTRAGVEMGTTSPAPLELAQPPEPGPNAPGAQGTDSDPASAAPATAPAEAEDSALEIAAPSEGEPLEATPSEATPSEAAPSEGEPPAGSGRHRRRRRGGPRPAEGEGAQATPPSRGDYLPSNPYFQPSR